MRRRIITKAALFVAVLLTGTSSFSLGPPQKHFTTNPPKTRLFSSAETTDKQESTAESLKRTKSDLLDACRDGSNIKLIRDLVDTISSVPSEPNLWLSGTWELFYTPDDLTRSSPFFTAFRQAVSQADQIYDITDAIPAPLKELGPASQEVDLDGKSMISRVKVATLGGQATSIMTTRCTIMDLPNKSGGGDGNLLLRVDSTKPEDSTIINKLFGSFADSVNASTPPFPSGRALEQIQKGSSQVAWKHLFCDETLRISSYGDEPNFCVWTRKEFSSFSEI